MRPISKAGTGKLLRISTRRAWPKKRSTATPPRPPMHASDTQTRKRRTCYAALALCRGFPETGRRLMQELDLLVMLGPALVTTAGYSAAEVGETYHRALDL